MKYNEKGAKLTGKPILYVHWLLYFTPVAFSN